MHRRRLITLAILAAPALVASACGGDDPPADPVGTGGAAGASGSGGAGGSGGADGGATGGSAGKAGSGGAGGATGKGGSAGTAIDGGTAGKAGAAGAAGSAGSGGGAGAGGAGKGGAAGAGTDGGSVDAHTDSTADARPEASSDTSTGDGGAACANGPAMGRTCTNYCNDWFGTCQPIAMWSTTYADQAACLSACSTWADAKLCCRAEHVDNAVKAGDMNGKNNHCGHAAGLNGPAPCAN